VRCGRDLRSRGGQAASTSHSGGRQRGRAGAYQLQRRLDGLRELAEAREAPPVGLRARGDRLRMCLGLPPQAPSCRAAGRISAGTPPPRRCSWPRGRGFHSLRAPVRSAASAVSAASAPRYVSPTPSLPTVETAVWPAGTPDEPPRGERGQTSTTRARSSERQHRTGQSRHERRLGLGGRRRHRSTGSREMVDTTGSRAVFTRPSDFPRRQSLLSVGMAANQYAKQVRRQADGSDSAVHLVRNCSRLVGRYIQRRAPRN
jgi:hypothetical protein